MTRLRAAAPGVRVVGMTYYLPPLVEWLNGTAGQVIARLSEKLAAGCSELLARAYAESGARIADVLSAFDISNFGDQVTVPGIGIVPRNVALICQWTWAYAAPATRAEPARQPGRVQDHNPGRSSVPPG